MDLLAILVGAILGFTVLLGVLVATLYPKKPQKQDFVKKCKRCECDK